MTKGPVPRDDENELNQPQTYEDWSAGNTCRHRRIQTGAILADVQTCYFIIGRQDKLSFGAKTTVQCSDQLKHKIAVKCSKREHCRPNFGC